MTRSPQVVAALVALLATALPATAQQPAAVPAPAAAAPGVAQTAPTATSAEAPAAIMRAPALLPVVTFEEARADAPDAALALQTRRSSVALMVVGAAAMVVGSLIDGDTGTIFMVGGAAIGLWGLYHYLR